MSSRFFRLALVAVLVFALAAFTPAAFAVSSAGGARLAASADATGDPTPEPEPGKATSCTLSSRSCVIPYGGKSTISGYLRADMPMVGVLVVLEQKVGKEWLDTRKRARTTFDSGRFSFTVAPADKTTYRVRYDGAEGYQPSLSSELSVYPRAWLGTPSVSSRVRRGRSFTTLGDLKPRHKAGSYVVRVEAYRLERGKWIKRWSGMARSSNYRTWTRYSRSMSFRSTGKWRVRAYHSSQFHAATYSSWRSVTVY